MATKPTTTTIPVRLSVLVQVDPAKWFAQQPAAPTVDQDAVLKGLTAAGIPEEQAKSMVAQLSTPPAAATGPAAVRTELRAHMLQLLQSDERIKAAGATVVDADRQPKPASK